MVTGETQHDYDLCILASGSNSDLAQNRFKGRLKRPYGWGCLWTTFKLPNSLSPHYLHQRCQGTHKMMGILPVRKKQNHYEAALYWSVNSKDLYAINNTEFASVKKEIMQFWPEAAACIEPLQHNDFIPAHYNDIWTPTPFVNRLVAIGDVSHATSPQLGQGCTMALLDAGTLAMSIDKNDTNVSDKLQQWWALRRYQLLYVRWLSKMLTPLYQSDNAAYGIFRDWVMAPTGRLPTLHSLQLRTLTSEVFLKAPSIR